MPMTLDGLELGNIVATGKSSNAIQITQELKPFYWDTHGCDVIWEPQAFNHDPEASRLTISLCPYSFDEDEIMMLDDWVKKALQTNSQEYFGQVLSFEEVSARFVSALKISAKGYKSLRGKMNLAGKNAVRIWDWKTKKLKDPPQSWVKSEIKCKFHIKGVWLQQNQCGLLIELVDVLVHEKEAQCPFDDLFISPETYLKA